MTDKNGTHQQRRAALFPKTPATATSLCPFMKPLPKDGQWARLPKLKTRSYTLRQLYDGYVYVFDETAGTLHEYAASASDGHLSRIVWTDAH
ncbi:toxin VasX, partial [Pseudomonas syringae]|uniref:toxin VasX n=1 Tax=Pseudomonas syringae TaxID=317 RepID=UPI0003576CBD